MVTAEKSPVVVVGDVTGPAAALIGSHAENCDEPAAGSAHERGHVPGKLRPESLLCEGCSEHSGYFHENYIYVYICLFVFHFFL